MAAWGDFSRAPLLDGGITPNNNLPHNHTGTNANAYNYPGADSNPRIYLNHTVNTNSNTNITDVNANNDNDNDNTRTHTADTDVNATANTTDYGYLPNAPDIPDAQDFVDNTGPNSYSLSPLSSFTNNNSFFATVGNTLSGPSCTTSNTANSLPFVNVGNIFQGGLPILTSSRVHPLSLPLPAPSTRTQSQAPSVGYWGRHPCPTSSGQLVPRSGGYSLHEPSRSYPIPSPSYIQGSTTQNSYIPGASSLSSSTVVPTILSRAHMSNAHHRPIPPESQTRQLPRITEAAPSFEDPFLATLATQNFTSPSLPPLSWPSSPNSPSALPGQGMPQTSARRRILDLTKEEPDSETSHSGVDSSIPPTTMPANTQRRSVTGAVTPFGRKRQPAATSPSNRPSKTRRKDPTITSNNLPSPFDDDDILGLDSHDGFETVDLSNATEVPAELMAPKVDNRVKIGKFQCVICMDDTTALAVTHCGHLFCSECLHSSLHIDSMKRTCPVCRTKVDLKDKKGKTTKSYYHLELKVMTATKKGKRPADT